MLYKKLHSAIILNFLFLFIILLLSKIIKHPPNFTPLISLIIISSLLIKNKAILISNILLSMIVSDLIIGFYGGISISYLVFIIIAVTSDKIFKKINLIKIICLGFYASLLFYLTTTPLHLIFNDSNMISFKSLIYDYQNGFYFFLNTLSSTIIFNILFFYLLKNYNNKIFSSYAKS